MFWYFLNDKKSKENKQVEKKVDSYELTKKLPGYTDVLNAFGDKDYSKAYQKTEEIIKQQEGSVSNDVMSSLKLTSAAALINTDTEKGSKYYLDIYNNKENSDINRAYALVKLAINLEVLAQNPTELKLLEEEVYRWSGKKDLSKKELTYLIYKQSYDLYPLSYSIARVAYYEAVLSYRDNLSTTTATFIREKYLNNIDKAVQDIIPQEGLHSLIAGSYFFKAIALGVLAGKGLAEYSEIVSAFNSSLSYNKIYGSKAEQQFFMMTAADFLAETKNEKDFKTIFNSLTEDGSLEKEVISFLQKIGKISYRNLYERAKTDKELRDFFEKNGLTI